MTANFQNQNENDKWVIDRSLRLFKPNCFLYLKQFTIQ